MDPLDIGIVGGSIAGCSAAIHLSRAGHRVRVYERSTGGLVGRGGGIGTPVPVLESLVEEGILGRDFPHFVLSAMPFVVRTDSEPRFGHSAWEMPANLAAFHWSALWNALRAGVPDGAYRSGVQVTGVAESQSGRVTLEMDGGESAEVDLAIFADGYRSLGRGIVCPDAELRYRGYMLWRGLLPESELGDGAGLGTKVPRLSYVDAPGHLVAYLVPGQDGSTRPGERLVNWAAYVALPAAELEEFMVDRWGTPRTGTVAPGDMRPEQETALKAFLVPGLPDYYGEIVDRTERTYVQLIYTVRVPSYHRGRICLVGDAGGVAQPFTGSGVFKGHGNVTGLLAALERRGSVDDALAEWSAAQVATSDRLLALGEQMEQAFVWSPLDLTDADEATTEAWWKSAVTFPEEFTYAADSSSD